MCLKPEVSKFTLGKALLAYTYSCLRNNAKAMEIARVVAAAQPAEDSVVSTLGCTFKVLRAEKEFAELYENAMKKKQMEDSYVLELFSCYCRLNDPKKMQFIAQKFHKAHPNKACYLFWSVTCMMLQDLPPTMLVLAEKMAQKVLYDLSNLTQPSADEMALFAFILVRQGKFAQAYDSLVQLRNRPSGQPFADEAHFAENPNLVKMLDLQVSIHKLDLLIRQGRLAEVMQECKHVLLSQPDQWNVHKVMVDVILNTTQSSKKSGGAPAAPVAPTAAELLEQKQLIFPMQDLSALLTKVLHADNEDSDSETDSAVSSTEPVTAAQMSAVTQHLQYLRQLQANKPKLRGPYLAELYLISGWLQMLQKQDITVLVGESLWIYSDSSAAQAGAGGENLPFNPSESPMVRMAQELASLISQYALRFQTKQCCFSDLRPYLASLHQIEGHHLNIAAAHSSTTTSTNTSLVAATQQWALSQREAVGEKLHAAMSAAIAAKAAPPLVTPEPASAEPATPACTVTAAAQGPAAAEVEAEDADQDDEDAADTTTGASAGSITDTAPTTGGTGGASAAAAAKKKKNKKKKKSAAAKTAAAAASGTVTSAHVGTPSVAEMLERNKGVVDEHTDVLLLLCNYCKFDQIVSYCDTLLLNSSAAKTNATVATGTAEDEMARRVALYSASRELFKLGVGGERRNVQPGDELLLQNSSLYRRAFIQVSTTTGAAASAATGATAAVDIATGAAGDATGAAATPSTAAVGVGLDTDKQKAAVQWARCLLQGKEASPYAFAFKMDLLEPYRALALGEPAHSSFGDMGVKHIQVTRLLFFLQRVRGQYLCL